VVRLGVLVSGRGSNLEAVLDAIRGGRLADVIPAIVISNRPGIPALDVATRHGVPSLVLEGKAFVDTAERDRAIGRALSEADVDLTLLAGYDQRLRDGYFTEFRGTTINIHPSLLPRHGGRGMTGLAVHRSVLDAGEAETGVTIHLVTPDLDAGPILAQERVAVQQSDDPERLAQRVLPVEHRLLVQTLSRLAAQGLPTKASVSMSAALAP
jgi:phosphoribosylglycinamide formyltransferase-1